MAGSELCICYRVGVGGAERGKLIKEEGREKPMNLQVTLQTCLLQVQKESILKFSISYKFQENL